MGMAGRQQVRRGMTPYSKLVVRSNPPLPLQVGTCCRTGVGLAGF